MRIPYISLIAAGALTLGGCAYGDLGLGLGYGDPYGYGSYGSPFGWYDNYYYPGSGMYVYDSYRRPHMWSDRQRAYWMSRQQSLSSSGKTASTTANWSGFSSRSSTLSADRLAARQERMQARQERIQAREERRRDRDSTQP